jgi:hypothetical protein
MYADLAFSRKGLMLQGIARTRMHFPPSFLRGPSSICVGIAACVFMAGCYHKPIPRPSSATVAGTVTYKGSPLPAGSVRFTSKTDPPREAAAGIREEGKFVAVNVPTGDLMISVDTEMLRINVPNLYVKLPVRYRRAHTSGLTVNVAAGENPPLNLELKD